MHVVPSHSFLHPSPSILFNPHRNRPGNFFVPSTSAITFFFSLRAVNTLTLSFISQCRSHNFHTHSLRLVQSRHSFVVLTTLQHPFSTLSPRLALRSFLSKRLCRVYREISPNRDLIKCRHCWLPFERTNCGFWTPVYLYRRFHDIDLQRHDQVTGLSLGI